MSRRRQPSYRADDRSMMIGGLALDRFEAGVGTDRRELHAPDWVVLSSGIILAPLRAFDRALSVSRDDPDRQCTGPSLDIYAGEARKALIWATGWDGLVANIATRPGARGGPTSKALLSRIADPHGPHDQVAFLCPWALRHHEYRAHVHRLPAPPRLPDPTPQPGTAEAIAGVFRYIHCGSHCPAYRGCYYLAVIDPLLPREIRQ